MSGRLTIPESVVWTDLGDEVVVLNLHTGFYFGLEQCGARIWNLLSSGRSPDQIARIIRAEYDVTGERAACDLDDLIAELSREGLLKPATVQMADPG